MSTKLHVNIASGNSEKVQTALMYAKKTIKHGWIEDVRVMFFGPSENLLVSDMHATASALELAGLSRSTACKFLADWD
ncbi:MAG: hypothetical protein ACFFEE_03335 [Candidatus Thorarchaeota archaeon]